MYDQGIRKLIRTIRALWRSWLSAPMARVVAGGGGQRLDDSSAISRSTTTGQLYPNPI